MGVTLPSGDPDVGGFRLSEVKQALVLCSRHRSAFGLFNSKVFLSDLRERAVMQRELDDRGYFNHDRERGSMESVLSRDGKAIASAKSRRYPLSKAQQLIEEMIGRIERYNASGRHMHRVDQVWLFGSVLREETTVGDIDIRYTLSTDPRYAAEGAYAKQRRILLKEVPASIDYGDALYWHEKKCINGERKHPLMAGVSQGIRDLVDLSVPCRKIYDMTLGGRVDDPTLPRHPESRGRAKYMNPPLVMPDLGPCTKPPRPLHAGWLSDFERHGFVYNEMAVAGTDLEANDVRILTRIATPQPPDPGVDFEVLDGIERFRMKMNRWGGQGLLVERGIVQDGESCTLKARVHGKDISEEGWDVEGAEQLGKTMAFVLSGDLLHMTRRMQDQGITPKPRVVIEFVDFDPALAEALEESLWIGVDDDGVMSFAEDQGIQIDWEFNISTLGEQARATPVA